MDAAGLTRTVNGGLMIIGLDRYHLVVSDNGQVIGGITESQNTWQGVLSTTRTP